MVGTLESLERTAPLASVDTAVVRKVVCGGLPTVDLAPLLANCPCALSRWALMVPGMRKPAARRTVKEQLAAPLEHYIRLYNAQLQSWLKESIARVVEPYLSQAEVFREQLRRMTASETGSVVEGDTAELIRGLQELEQAGMEEKEAAAP